MTKFSLICDQISKHKQAQGMTVRLCLSRDLEQFYVVTRVLECINLTMHFEQNYLANYDFF